MTLRLKRHRETEDTLARVLEQRDVLITKLVRNDAKLKVLLRAKARLEKAMSKEVPMSVSQGKLLDPVVLPKPGPALNDPIPSFLKRKKQEAKAADVLAAAPLTGKAAQAAIRARA